LLIASGNPILNPGIVQRVLLVSEECMRSIRGMMVGPGLPTMICCLALLLAGCRNEGRDFAALGDGPASGAEAGAQGDAGVSGGDSGTDTNFEPGTGIDAGPAEGDVTVDGFSSELDSADQEVGDEPDSETACEALRITCWSDEGPIAAVSEFVMGESSPECLFQDEYEVSSGTGVAWRLEYDDRTDLSPGRQERGRLLMWPRRPGVATLVVDVRGCTVVGPRLNILPPADDSIRIHVEWWPAEGDPRRSQTGEMDLHILQSAQACWFDEEHDRHLAGSARLDWGVPDVISDDPGGIVDDPEIEGLQTSTVDYIASDEVWEVGVHARVGNRDRGANALNARAWISRSGEVLFTVARTFEKPAYWSVGFVSNDGVEVVDEVSEEVPECAER
jgi:hypothetical protein